MPNNCLSVLYKHIIQVENKNVGLKVGGHKHTIAPPVKKVGGLMPPLPPPPTPLPTPMRCIVWWLWVSNYVWRNYCNIKNNIIIYRIYIWIETMIFIL